MKAENAGAGLVLLFSILMVAGGVMIIVYSRAMEDPLLIWLGVGYILNGLMDLILMYRVKDVLMGKGTVSGDDDSDDDGSVK